MFWQIRFSSRPRPVPCWASLGWENLISILYSLTGVIRWVLLHWSMHPQGETGENKLQRNQWYWKKICPSPFARWAFTCQTENEKRLCSKPQDTQTPAARKSSSGGSRPRGKRGARSQKDVLPLPFMVFCVYFEKNKGWRSRASPTDSPLDPQLSRGQIPLTTSYGATDVEFRIYSSEGENLNPAVTLAFFRSLTPRFNLLYAVARVNF